MNCRCFTYFVVLIFLMSGAFILIGTDEDVSAYAPEVITDMTMDCTSPEAHGDNVVYHGYIPGTGYRVYLMDIRTGVSQRIVEFDSMSPDISGDRIVFKGYRDSQWDLFIYSISSQTLTRLTNDATEEMWPKIDGIDIVYSAYIGGGYDVFHINAVTQNFRRLDISSGHDVGANVHDGLVVWMSRPDIYSIIMGHDIGTGMTFEIDNQTGYNLSVPDVYGDRVVYTYGNTYENTVVLLHNLTTEMFIILSPPLTRSTSPRIFRENIVFTTVYDGIPEIMLFNMDRGYEQRLTHDSGYKSYPSVWGEHLYYESLRGFSYINHILLDFDDDGIPDQKDMFPYDHNEHFDFDGDGMGDYKDYDDDNDGFEDPLDAFPRDPDEWYDFDGDGLGDNQDEDDDNDGIPDIEDPDPRDPNTPIIGLLHDILIRLDEMEGNMIDRINGLEETMAEMAEEDSDSLFDRINNSLISLEEMLSNLNFSFNSGMDGILGNVEDVRNMVENAQEEEDPWDTESFFDVFADLMVNVTQGLYEYMEGLMGAINDTARGINETGDALNALDTLDGIVSDLENMGKNIESQNEDIEDTGSQMGTNMLILIIVFSVWSIIILGFIFARTNKAGASIMEDD